MSPTTVVMTYVSKQQFLLGSHNEFGMKCFVEHQVSSTAQESLLAELWGPMGMPGIKPRLAMQAETPPHTH